MVALKDIAWIRQKDTPKPSFWGFVLTDEGTIDTNRTPEFVMHVKHDDDLWILVTQFPNENPTEIECGSRHEAEYKAQKRVAERQPHAITYHVDDVLSDPNAPSPLLAFLWVHKAPAFIKQAIEQCLGVPTLFASHKGKPVRVTMASRFGDVGVTTDLKRDIGYDTRVSISELNRFTSAVSDKPLYIWLDEILGDISISAFPAEHEEYENNHILLTEMLHGRANKHESVLNILTNVLHKAGIRTIRE